MTTTPQPALGSMTPGAATDDAWLDAPVEQGTRFSIFDVVLILVRQRWVIVGTIVVCALLAVFIALRTPKQYESTVTILPPAEIATRGIGGSINDIQSALQSGAGFSFNAKEDFWTSVMKGHTILDRIIVQKGLMQEYHVKLMSQAESVLKSKSSFDIDKAGLITIGVKDHDPKRAAELANAYIDSLHASMVDMAIDDANQRQQFYNQQVQEEQDRLAEAEKKMMDVQRKTGVLEISGQTSEAIRMVGDLRAKITVLNVQLQALRASATDANPEVQRLKAELEADQTALSKAENSQGATGLGDVGTSEVPQAALEYIHAARDVRYHESLTEALGKQVEAARMDEARSAPAVQIVDPAVPSDHPAGISRTLMVVIGIFIGFVLGLVLAILRQAWWNIKASEEGQEKWRQLVETLQERA